MGGASSYYSMLCICGFLSTVWVASKFSRLVGVSSIVLEISMGVILGPQVVGLISSEYAVCEQSRHVKCTPPPNAKEMALEGQFIEGFARFSTPEYCDLHLFLADHGGNSSMGHGRRLSGGGGGGTPYHSFEECLEESCEAEVQHHCGLRPDIFTLIGHAGVALMIFESGMHFDFEKAKVVGGPACAVAVLGTFLPLAGGCLLMMMFGRPFMPDGISAGTALAPTSVGIALRLLGEAGVLQENFGQAIITAAFVDDILSLILFNVLFSLRGHFDLFKTIFAPLIGVAFMLVAMVAAVKFWPRIINGIMSLAPQQREATSTGFGGLKLERDEILFLLQITLLVVYSFITHLLGTHLWGCFIAGMSFACLTPPHHAHDVWAKQTKRMTSWMIRIFFSCTVAFSIPIAKLLSLAAFWKGSILGVFACILTKVCCAPFMGSARWVIGWAMVGRAEFAYLIAQMALSGKMLDEESFSIVIWALLYATIFAPFVFRWLLNRYVRKTNQEGSMSNNDQECGTDSMKKSHGEIHTKQNQAAELDNSTSMYSQYTIGT